MVEIPFSLPIPRALGGMRDLSFGRASRQATEATPIRDTSVISRLTPLFSIRHGYSPGEERQLAADTQVYNSLKDTIETMMDKERHVQVGAVYDELMWRYANQPKATITIFGKSFSLGAPERESAGVIFEPYISPFSQRAENIPLPV